MTTDFSSCFSLQICMSMLNEKLCYFYLCLSHKACCFNQSEGMLYRNFIIKKKE